MANIMPLKEEKKRKIESVEVPGACMKEQGREDSKEGDGRAFTLCSGLRTGPKPLQVSGILSIHFVTWPLIYRLWVRGCCTAVNPKPTIGGD